MSEEKKRGPGRPVNHLLRAYRADPAATAAIIQREMERAVEERSGDVTENAAKAMGVSRASLERMLVKEEGLRHLRAIRIKPSYKTKGESVDDVPDWEDVPSYDIEVPPEPKAPEPPAVREPGQCYCGRPSLTPSGWCAKGYCQFAYKFGVNLP